MRSKFLVCALAFTIGVLIGSAGTSSADHTSSLYIDGVWLGANSHDIASGDISGMTGSPSSATIRRAMEFGGDSWDALPNASTFTATHDSGHSHTQVSVTNHLCSDLTMMLHEVWGFSAIQSQMVTSTANAQAFWCRTAAGNIYTAWTQFRRNPHGSTVWYYPNAKPPGGASAGNWKSFPGVMVHEFGHIVGFGTGFASHFTGGTHCDNLPAINNDQTMCTPGAPVSHTSWYYNTLEAHDISVFQSAY